MSLSDIHLPVMPKSHAGGSDTERQAAELAMPKAGILRALALDAHRIAYPVGLTDDELAIATNRTRYQICQRRVELRDGGWVEDSGIRRPSDNGRSTMIVWRLTPQAAERLGVAR